MMQELSLNVLDVAQNSVRAQASLIQIIVDEQPDADLLTVSIADNGCGMTPDQVAHVTDPFFTTRTTRKVGLGIPFLKMAAEMTGGRLEIQSAVGVGTTTTATFGRGHIDRMPLGDMTATICSLIQCNPDLDFTYTYRFSGQEFTADTREFRVVLEGLPLSNPDVIGFIGAFIRENTAEMQNEIVDGGVS